MSKDPAFLFYSKDFYEGTRMMMPEERACYIDLMIYQHQNGFIPDDIKRLSLYCTGCGEQTIKSVLHGKFDLSDLGWVNQKLSLLMNSRSKNKPKKIASATLAGLISSSNLTKEQALFVKKSFQIEDILLSDGELTTNEMFIKTRVKEWFTKMVNHLVDHMVDNMQMQMQIDINSLLKEYDLSFLEEPYKETVINWLIYKKERDEKYKSTRTLSVLYSQLKKLSNNNPETAKLIVEQSIANNWAGIFQLKTQNQKPQYQQQKNTTKQIPAI